MLPLLPIGIRLITSTPQATAMSTTPEPTSEEARLVACCDEPHCVSTVVAAVESGRPAASQAVRVMLKALLADLADATPHDLADLGRIEADTVDQRSLDGGQQFARMHR